MADRIKRKRTPKTNTKRNSRRNRKSSKRQRRETNETEIDQNHQENKLGEELGSESEISEEEKAKPSAYDSLLSKLGKQHKPSQMAKKKVIDRFPIELQGTIEEDNKHSSDTDFDRMDHARESGNEDRENESTEDDKEREYRNEEVEEEEEEVEKEVEEEEEEEQEDFTGNTEVFEDGDETLDSSIPLDLLADDQFAIQFSNDATIDNVDSEPHKFQKSTVEELGSFGETLGFGVSGSRFVLSPIYKRMLANDLDRDESENGAWSVEMLRDAFHVRPRVIYRWASQVLQKELQCKNKKQEKIEDHAIGKVLLGLGCPILNPLQKLLFVPMNSYADIIFTGQTIHNFQDIMDIYALHIVNHILKARDVVVKHNTKIRDNEIDVDTVQDQGYTRPRVLVLLPMRNSAHKFVKALLRFLPPSQQSQVDNRKRFDEEYGDFDDDGLKEKRKLKGEEFSFLFSGNNDDCFHIGISFTRKTVKIYSSFYNSDLIIASPLGLKVLEGKSGTSEMDFLSSIEVMIIDQADVMVMQNWSHTTDVADIVNKTPEKLREIDFSRVRSWCLNGWAKHFRQTIVISSLQHVQINSFINSKCKNKAGVVRINVAKCNGVLHVVVPKVRQVFQKIEVSSIASQANDRFQYFKDRVLPHIREGAGGSQGHTLIFIPSYFDFVRVRNLMRNEELSFCACNEYTRNKDLSRYRAWFAMGRRLLMLYTERFHYFRKVKLRGIHHVVFYGTPVYRSCYADILNMIDADESISSTSLTLFSKYDMFELERIIGSKKSKQMLNSDTNTFLFC